MRPLAAILGALLLQPSSIEAARLPVEGRAPTFDRGNGWLNSPSLGSAELRGKVVLVDFWTYSCINWRRTLPWLRAWSEKYQDHGLVIVGVHTPEFGFEKDLDNIRRAASEQDVDYPVVIDSDYAIWDAFDNHYWPALYFVDAQGRIRHQKFGEGDYPQLEAIIQQLLIEAGHDSFERQFVSVEGRGAEADANWQTLRSPETYLGFARSNAFSSPGASAPNRSRVYAFPERLQLNQWALSGDWILRRESAVANAAPGKLAIRFHARDVHLVAGPGSTGKSVRFRVTIDGQPPDADRGGDIDAKGDGTIDQPRMYQLIRQSSTVRERQIEIEFLDSSAEVFVFTFG